MTTIEPELELWPYQAPPLGGAAALLHEQTCTGRSIGREILLEGRAGTGKSIAALSYAVACAYVWPGTRALLARATRTSMTESTLVTLENEVLGADHPAVINGPTRAGRDRYEIGGSSLVLGGLDHPERLFSTAWDLIIVDEAIEIPLDAWELFGRAQRRRMGTGGMPYRQRVALLNPGAPAHWANVRATPCSDGLRRIETWEDYARLQRYNYGPQAGAMRRLVSVHQDNPAYWSMEEWDWTPAGRDMLAGLQAMSGHNRARMLEGRWVAASGSIYPEFSTELHTIDIPEGFPPADWPIDILWDPGYDHPTAILFVTTAPNDRQYIFDEIYAGGQSVAQHCATISRKLHGRTIRGLYGDPQYVDNRTAMSTASIVDQCREQGYRMVPWPRTGNAEGERSMIEAVRQRLVAGRLMTATRCTATIGEWQSWSWKRNAKGEPPPGGDVPEDRNNHCQDCIRGLVALYLKHAGAGGWGIKVRETPR